MRLARLAAAAGVVTGALLIATRTREAAERFAAAASRRCSTPSTRTTPRRARTSAASPPTPSSSPTPPARRARQRERRARRALPRHRQDPRGAVRHHPREHAAHSGRATRDRHAPEPRRRGARAAARRSIPISRRACSATTSDGTEPDTRAPARPRIPLAARIVAIADTFDAITHVAAIAMARRRRTRRRHRIGRGTQFDPAARRPLLLSARVRSIDAQERAFRRKPRARSARTTAPRGRVVTPDITFRWRPANLASSGLRIRCPKERR